MSAGNRDQKIIIQTATRAKDSAGQGIVTYSTYRELWAEVRPLSGYEKRIAGKLTPEQTHVVTIRRDDTVNADDQILWGTRTLGIEVAEMDRRRNETIFTCRETKVIT